MTLADRILILNAGVIEQFDTPENVYKKPASTFVAGFIGSPPMNLMAVDGKILGVRPEHLEIEEVPTAASWQVVVQATELLGAEALIYAKRMNTVVEESLVIRVDSDAIKPAIGDTLYVSPRADQLHWFDAKTQKRLV